MIESKRDLGSLTDMNITPARLPNASGATGKAHLSPTINQGRPSFCQESRSLSICPPGQNFPCSASSKDQRQMPKNQCQDSQEYQGCRAHNYTQHCGFEGATHSAWRSVRPQANSGEDRRPETTDRRKEQAEVEIVPLPHAVVDKWAMVVVSKNAAIAISTMFCPRRLHHFAKGTPSVASTLQCYHLLFISRTRHDVKGDVLAASGHGHLLFEPLHAKT